jgi:hypothetical protein
VFIFHESKLPSISCYLVEGRKKQENCLLFIIFPTAFHSLPLFN